MLSSLRIEWSGPLNQVQLAQHVRIIGVTLATALFAVVATEASWWRTFRFTDRATAVHVIRKVILQQTAIVNHVLPF